MNLDNGIEGMVVNHLPLSEVKLKRLMLLFDKIHFAPPSDNLCFLEDNALSYEILSINTIPLLITYNGSEIADRFKNVKKTPIPTEALAFTNIYNFNENGKNRLIFNMTRMVDYYKGEVFKKEEEQLFEKFDLAIDKSAINILDYKRTDFYKRNALNLKIAYDTDVGNLNNYQLVRSLMDKTSMDKNKDGFIPSPMLPTPGGLDIFSGSNYNSKNFKDFNDSNDFETQFFSIIGKLNKKIALCDEFNLNPIFVNESMHHLYLNKIKLSTKCTDEKFLNEWHRRYDFPLHDVHNLLFNTSFYFLSDDVLKSLSTKLILQYKEKSFFELYKLRSHIVEELANLRSHKWEHADMKEVKKLIENKIKKDLLAYQQAKNESFFRFFNFTTGAIGGMAAAAFSYTQNLSPILISILSGVAPQVINEAASFVRGLDEKKNKKFENTFAYFYNLEKYK